MNFIKIIFGVICLTFLLNGCIEIPVETSQGVGYVEWITVMGVNGDNEIQVCEGSGKPFLVPNFDTSKEEMIIVNSGNFLEVMDIDGSNRRTLMRNAGEIEDFNSDRTQIILKKNYDLFIYTFSNGDYFNITNSNDERDWEASFSNDDKSIVYRTDKDNLTYLSKFDIEDNTVTKLYEFTLSSSESEITFMNPRKLEEKILLQKFETINNTEKNYTSSLCKYDVVRDTLESVYVESFVEKYDVNEKGEIIIICETPKVIDVDGNVLYSDLPKNLCSGNNVSFSSNGRYAYSTNQIVDLENTLGYDIKGIEIDLNLSENKIMAITSTIYGGKSEK